MTEMHLPFRERTAKTTARTTFILIAISLGLLLSIFAGQSGTLLFYIVVFFTLWARRWDWEYFGMTRTAWLVTIQKAFFFSILLFILLDVLVQPLAELYWGRIDLSEFSEIEGNWAGYVLYVMLGWILGGFCEEVIYRGYVVKRLAVIFGDTSKAWLLSTTIASIAFGLAHAYQGPAGIITTAVIGFTFGLVFAYNRNNLVLLILMHGIYNTIVITLMFIGKVRIVTEWVLGFLT